MRPTTLPLRCLSLAAALLLAACAAPPTPRLATSTTRPALPAAPTGTPRPAPTPTPTAAPGTATPTPAPTLTPLPPTGAPPAGPALTFTERLAPAGAVRAYPGPLHYAGDVLTLEVALEGFAEAPEGPATIQLDAGEPRAVEALWQGNVLILPQALDTSGLAGAHTLTVAAENGALAVNATYAFELQPAEARPAAEALAERQTETLPCCVLHYLSHTAAARDIAQLAGQVQQAAADFAALTGATLPEPFQIYFLDRMWGNGAFGGLGELAIVYTDRNYGPAVGEAGLRTLLLHELTHAARLDQGPDGFFVHNEGLAVYLAGGHYKPEPIPERGAALEALGYYGGRAGGWDYPIHETIYLHGAARVAYVDATYGRDKLWEFVQAASGPEASDPALLNEDLRAVLGVSLDAFDAGYLDWLRSKTPGAQLDDLRLTLELQGLRREYQEAYAPPPFFIFGLAADTHGRPEAFPAQIRESDAPANVAVELMIANGQAAIAAARYGEAQALVEALAATLAEGEFAHPLAAEYLSAVLALAAEGRVAVGLALAGGQATARVRLEEGTLAAVGLRREAAGWVVAGAP
jgi:hypothetical protein